MAKQSVWRVLAVMGAAAIALAIATSAFTQAPPPTPHQFFGSEPTGSGALIDGAPAPDGAVVTAWNHDGVAIATAVIADGVWALQVGPDDASRVVFTIDDSLPSASIEVRAAAFEEVRLALTSPPEEDAPAEGAVDTAAGDDAATADDIADDDASTTDTTAESFAMPVTGSAGLADGGGRRPVLSLIFAISALLGMGGVIAVRRMRA